MKGPCGKICPVNSPKPFQAPFCTRESISRNRCYESSLGKRGTIPRKFDILYFSNIRRLSYKGIGSQAPVMPVSCEAIVLQTHGKVLKNRIHKYIQGPHWRGLNPLGSAEGSRVQRGRRTGAVPKSQSLCQWCDSFDISALL